MRGYTRDRQLLAAGLAALAGFVDALGFIALGGLFASFMSGNSTRLAVGIAGQSHQAGLAAALIGAFVCGVATGALAARAAGLWRKQALLALVATLLTAGAMLATANVSATGVTLIMAAAMGAANNVFQRDGEVSVGVTYMTGTLVKLGQRLAGAFSGGDRLGWLPYLLLWCALLIGAIAGAAIYPTLGLRALWIASIWALLLAIASLALGPVAASIDARR